MTPLPASFGSVIETIWGITAVRGLAWSLVAALLVITPMALIAIWVERRLSGLMQARIGPNRTGPQGLLQTLADGVKLLAKESLVPTDADRPLFLAAPAVVFMSAFAMYAALPWGPDWTPTNLAVGLHFVLGVGSIEAIGVIMAGWASNNKWALLGTMRVAAQVVAYEIPLGISALVPVLTAGTLNVQEMTAMQGGGFWNWGLFWAFPANIVAFIIFFWAALANLKRAPFDLPEAESELVAGFHTEYSGMSFSIFFLAEYAAMFVLSGIAACLWLGGWNTGIPGLDVASRALEADLMLLGVNAGRIGWNLVGVAMVGGKAFLLVCVMMWLRWTLPRLRVDQVMRLCWKFFLPISLACLVWAAAWVSMVKPMLGGNG